ncbi:hypothetical protein L596_022452 [Steinernema carpocapsae]|uniref:Uncharacterized protein n=1 Tax=Steinernema carpocapsae TaxID=34508 RepID=A0A4U5MLU8_STECR|nr:hypothetical protein L596_022452 [Steinernema carpocapsae]
MSSSAEDRPWNIMVDPRVYRGSVVAKKRAEIAKINEEIRKIQDEERYRADVIRNKLNMTLNQDAQGLPDVKRYSSHRYSRLSGPVGRRIRLNYSSVPAGEREIAWKVVEIALYWFKRSKITQKAGKTAFCKRTQTRPHWIPSGVAQPSKRIEKSTRIHVTGNGIRTTVDFKQVRFIAIDNLTQQPQQLTLPRESPTIRRKLRSPPPSRRRRSSISVPPPTARGPPQFTEAFVQTEESFDEIIAPLVQELTNTSIEAAVRSLQEEEQLQKKEREREEIIAILREQIKENEELAMKIKEEERKHEQVRQERDTIINNFQVEEGHILASKLINDVIDSCLNKMLEGNLLEDMPKVRSVAADTRTLEEERLHLELIHAELEKDFFPWMYGRAEKIRELQQAKMHLKEIIFGKNNKEKAKSKAELKAQLKRLN